MLCLNDIQLRLGDFELSANDCFQPGEKVAVIGPSGCGKSTLLGALAGFQDLTRGQITWNDKPLVKGPINRPMSILFQDNNLFPHLTVFQNAALGINPNLRLSDADRDRVDRALSDVGLNEKHDVKPGELSGGQMSRAALARVLLRDQPILLLDEPFAALGPALRHDMMDLVDQFAAKSNVLVLMVTHDPEDAKRFSDKTVLIDGGVAQPARATKDLFENPPNALKAYLGA